MKRILRLLIILPLLIWVACEDESKGDEQEDFIFNENVMECGLVENVYTFYNNDGTVETSNTTNCEWDGLTRTCYENGELQNQDTFNEYGKPIELFYPTFGWRVTLEYAEGWKQLSYTLVDSLGDTLAYEYSVWDNLTRTEYRTNGRTSISTYRSNDYSMIRRDDYNIDGELVWTNLSELEESLTITPVTLEFSTIIFFTDWFV